MVLFIVFQLYTSASNNLVFAFQKEKKNDEDEDEDDVKPR